MTEAHDFEDRASATRAVLYRLPTDTGLTAQELSGLVERADIVEGVTQEAGPEPLPGEQPALVGTFRYVIRNDELKTLGTFLDLLKGTATLVVGLISVPTAAGIKGVIDGVHGLYSTFKGLVDKGVVLSPEDFAVVSVLKRLKAASPDAIAEELRNIEARTVEAILERHMIRDGNARGFTRREDDGTWSLVGV